MIERDPRGRPGPRRGGQDALDRTSLRAGRRTLPSRRHRQEPWNPKFRLNLGMSLASLGRMGDAADEGLEAIRLDPDAPEIWEFLRNAGREAAEGKNSSRRPAGSSIGCVPRGPEPANQLRGILIAGALLKHTMKQEQVLASR